MKKTKNFELNLMESADLLSLTPLNQNVEILDEALKKQSDSLADKLKDQSDEQDTKILSRVMMAYGRYEGNGDISAAIKTPGFKPEVVLMRARTAPTPRTGQSTSTVLPGESFGGGWVLWNGVDLTAIYLKSAGTTDDFGLPYYSQGKCTIDFTAKNGELSWQLTGATDRAKEVDHGEVINNKNGQTYFWVAFGCAVE